MIDTKVAENSYLEKGKDNANYKWGIVGWEEYHNGGD